MLVTTVIFVNEVALDGSMIPRPVRVVHGRASIESQPDAPAAEFEWWSDTPPCEIGDRIWIGTVGGIPPKEWLGGDVTWGDPGASWWGLPVAPTTRYTPGQRWDRFHGWASRIEAIEQLGEIVAWKVTATGDIARLGGIKIRLERPMETDLQRVAAIAAEAKVVINTRGTASLNLGIDTIDRSALDAIQEICVSTGGLFWQALDGTFWYGTANHRDIATSFVLQASSILDGVQWSEDVNQIINSIRVVYPAPPLPPIAPTGDWNYVTSTDTGSDPGNGNVRANGAALDNSTTTIAISATAVGGASMRTVLKRLTEGARIYLALKTDSNKWARFTANSPATDNGTWFSITVDFKDEGTGKGPVPGTVVTVTADSRHQEEQNSFFSEDTASIAKWGTRYIEPKTLVADDTAASVLAATILSRRAQPYWVMPGVLVPYDDVNDYDYATMQQLDVSTGILIPVDDVPNPTPAPVNSWAVEGFVEEWREDGYWIQLSLSDWSRTSSGTINSWAMVRDQHNWTQAAAKSFRDLLVEAV